MPLPVCPYNPNRESYSASIPSGVVSTVTDGGFSRSRCDFVGNPYVLTVQWVCDAFKFEALQEFYVGDTLYGVNPFQINLRLDYSETETYTAQFVPGTWNADSVSGPVTILHAQLEVTPNPTDTDRDQMILDTYEYYTDELPDVLAALEKLVNINLPGAIPET